MYTREVNGLGYNIDFLVNDKRRFLTGKQTLRISGSRR
jgi:hypothetical protein